MEPSAEIYPSKGTVFTDIFLQIRGLDKYAEHEFAPAATGLELYLFWDDKNIITRMEDIVEHGYQGDVGPQGSPGETGPQGSIGPKGEKGDNGPYPLEAVLLNLGLSSVSVIVSVIALSMVYKMKKELKNAN